MAKYVVRQSGALEGDLVASGSKNAVLPLMAASLLTNEKCRINDNPALRDVEVLCHILDRSASIKKRNTWTLKHRKSGRPALPRTWRAECGPPS